jgi:hypothetical protein
MIFPIFTESFVYGKYLVTFPPLLRLQLNAAAPLVEAAGFGLDKKHAASLAGGRPGVL